MSVRLMAIVWELDLPPGEKLVLLALADQANDAGLQCWPSVETVARRSGQGVRTVRRALASLESQGHLTRDHRTGTSTQYRVHPCQNGSPADLAPLPKTTATPANLAPKPSGTTNGLANAKPKRARKSDLPDWLPAEPWAAYLEMRKRKRANPTPRAIELLLADLTAWRARGHDPGAILDNSTKNNWTGLFEPKEPANDRLPGSLNRQSDKRDGVARALDRRLGLDDPAGSPGRWDAGEGGTHRALPAPRAGGM